jgi:hypothetical protein
MRGDFVTTCLHYGRAARTPSVRRLCVSAAVWVLACALLAAFASAQYPGQIKIDKDKDKEQPSLRAVAVLEWTGDLSKPKTSRLVPIAVFDGEQLQDAGVYMARPAPLAVTGGVEYILQKDGSKLGLFDVLSAGQQDGAWFGFGAWKPMPKPKPAAVPQKIDDDFNSDKPVLHRKHGAGGGDSKSGGDAGIPGSAPDPDRPTLHKKAGSDSGTDDSAKSGDSGQTSSAPAPDADRPTLHKAPNSSSGSDQTSPQSTSQNSGQKSGDSSGSSAGGTVSSTTSSDPNRPALKRGKAKQEPDEGYVSSVDNTDPDRPKLARGKSAAGGSDVTPTLIGLPSGMEQAVAVSDPRNHPDHPWNYTWADPADELKMKAALEDAARVALGLQATPPADAAVKRTSTSTKGKSKAAAKPEPPEPAPLMDEEFRVFELAYGSGATMVLTAHTDGPPKEQKYVTLIGQPDLYGSLHVLFKSVTDGAHLDDTPRMRLVDAVDVLADNRGELLFELRGNTQRQFALYRVMRGAAKELFVTGGGATSID